MFSDEDRSIERSGGGVRRERELSKEVNSENRDSPNISSRCTLVSSYNSLEVASEAYNTATVDAIAL